MHAVTLHRLTGAGLSFSRVLLNLVLFCGLCFTLSVSLLTLILGMRNDDLAILLFSCVLSSTWVGRSYSALSCVNFFALYDMVSLIGAPIFSGSGAFWGSHGLWPNMHHLLLLRAGYCVPWLLYHWSCK